MQIYCPACKGMVEIEQRYPYHSGLGDEGYLYCDSCTNVLVYEWYDPVYSKLLNKKAPWDLTRSEQALLEEHLRPCTCGGHFRHSAHPRCPTCKSELINAVPGGKIYYVVVGQRFDPAKDNLWL